MNRDEFEEMAAATPGERALVPFGAQWALEAASSIDRHAPGFFVYLLRSKPLLRHAILSVMAHLRLEEPLRRPGPLTSSNCEEIGRLGADLMAKKPRELVEAAWGACPDGLLGCFSRMREPLEPKAYQTLFRVIADPREKRRRAILAYWPLITSERVFALVALDDALCCTRVGKKLRMRDEALMANDVLCVVRSHRPDLTDIAILEFASQADALSPLDSQLERLLHLVTELPPAPFEVPPDFLHLRSRAEFSDFSVHHRNCLITKFETEALTGRAMYWVYRRRPAIAVLTALETGWFLGRVHVPGNGAPPVDLVEEVRSRLATAGIPVLTPAKVEGPRATVRRLLMRHDLFGVSPDEFDGWVADID